MKRKRIVIAPEHLPSRPPVLATACVCIAAAFAGTTIAGAAAVSLTALLWLWHIACRREERDTSLYLWCELHPCPECEGGGVCHDEDGIRTCQLCDGSGVDPSAEDILTEE